MAKRDIVVMGASAGGLEALSDVTSNLPADFSASIFIVQHTASTFASRLPEILSTRSSMRATHAIHGEAIIPGHIYVAPPDNHLQVRAGYMHVIRGPKENNYRPSVDLLFRSAAAAYGPRVIGVVLSGQLDCGTAGSLSIKARGGITIAQDPAQATAASMPQSAIKHAQVDHVGTTAQIAELLKKLVQENVSEQAQRPIARPLMELEGDEPGRNTELVCPICQGNMTETSLQGLTCFRCHVGHSFTLDSAADAQSEEIERALWAASRALEEGAALSRRMAARSVGSLRESYEEKEALQTQQAQLIRQLVLDGRPLRQEPK
jgi:two-component system chemotaxis response regulator CheB